MYNYQEALKDDIREYIEENYTAEEISEKMSERAEWETELYDELWLADSVTGNASGSYTFHSQTAGEYVKDNMDLLQQALEYFEEDSNTIVEKIFGEEWEYLDVTIRCYLLYGAISRVLDEIEEEAEEEAEEGEDRNI